MNDFIRDDDWQKGVRDALIKPHFYERFCKEKRFVFNDKGAMAGKVQKRFAVDTIAQGRDGLALYIEEKIARYKGRDYDAYFLETESCTTPGRESPGWMVYGCPDALLYCFMRADRIDCDLIPFPALKKWFWTVDGKYARSVMRDTINHTAGRIVPVKDVKRNVGFLWQGTIRPDLTDPRQAQFFELKRAA